MKRLPWLGVIVLAAASFSGCSGNSEPKEKALEGKVESTEIQSAPGDVKPGGGDDTK